MIKKTEEISEKEVSKIISQSGNPPKIGDIVEGKVLAHEKSRIYVDLSPFGTGEIYGREYITARDLLRKVRVGDSVTAKVTENPNEDGYIELSLKEAKQALIWKEVEEAVKNKTALELTVQDANKGGLLLTWQGVPGFLPASQLKPDHYPRVSDRDKDKILDELRRLIGKKLIVSIIGTGSEDGKIIFSEKGDDETKQRETSVEKYKVGDVLWGEITGTVDFGVFVKLEEGLEGLVHISEIDWSLVEDTRKLFKIGDRVQVKVIEVKDGKVSLSIKALKENPWNEASKKYKKGDVVKGIIIKYNKHGALASIEEGVAGLIHVSEFGTEDKLRETLELGKIYDFKITLFDAKEQRMTLSSKTTSEKEKVEKK